MSCTRQSSFGAACCWAPTPPPPPPPPLHSSSAVLSAGPVVCILLILWPWPGQALSPPLSRPPSSPSQHRLRRRRCRCRRRRCSAANDTSPSAQPRSLALTLSRGSLCCSPRIDLTRPSIHLKDPTTLVSPSLPLALPLPRPSRKFYIVGSACTRLVLLGFHFSIRAFSELHNSPRRLKLVNTYNVASATLVHDIITSSSA